MAAGEETRKIQFTGKSSYIVSLPKRWVTDLGLSRGDQVRISRQGLTSLLVYPPGRRPGAARQEVAAVEVGAGEGAETVVRKLISLYFRGRGTVHVRPRRGRLSPAQRTAVKGAVKRMLMGAEIISDSSGGMTVQVLVNALELTVDGALKRMIHLARSMLADAVLAAREGNMELAGEVAGTDDEVDRFGFYIIRQLKIAVQGEHVLKEMGFADAQACLEYMPVVKNIERTGDHAVIIARDLLEFRSGIGGEAMDRIEEMHAFAAGALDSACLALFKGDHAQAERTISEAAGISRHERAVIRAAAGMSDGRGAYRARRIAENIRRIAEYASDISEAALNINIEKALKKA